MGLNQSTVWPLWATLSNLATYSIVLSLGSPGRVAAKCWAPVSPIWLRLRLRERRAREPEPSAYHCLPLSTPSPGTQEEADGQVGDPVLMKTPIFGCWERFLLSDLSPSCCNVLSHILSLGLRGYQPGLGYAVWKWVKG